ncbi:hypothetical protein [Curtobacterium flaccumfaciens]|uniref:hypothetical protein n=1 Tax=Curtobacterium flaccumfaciens TaxID=2035 RepID=UPI001367706B|nr:hypothetical protein [Curtobacterium flaccumfaciens]MBT1665410.1 hypothetical protein [Curtobacterium flaccumfaciens pv. flaccumfaciens]QHN62750.1 hypothetical protein GBG65_19715 [Curtobacterium flaccumfaciens pv. flaccumfaciens]
MPDEVLAIAALDFSEASAAGSAWWAGKAVAGLHADGKDFGAAALPGPEFRQRAAATFNRPFQQGGPPLNDLDASVRSHDEVVRRSSATSKEAVDSSFSEDEVVQLLGEGRAKVRWLLSVGDLFGFVAGGALRFPAWQFTNDAQSPVLPHLSRLVEGFQDFSPAAIRGFMTTDHEDTRLDGHPVTPVAWLREGKNPQPLIEILDSFLMS